MNRIKKRERTAIVIFAIIAMLVLGFFIVLTPKKDTINSDNMTEKFERSRKNNFYLTENVYLIIE